MSAAEPTPTWTLPQGARVLLVRLSALGDIIFALETLTTLKAERPDVRVDFLVEDRFARILRGHPLIEELIESPRSSLSRVPRHLIHLRRRRYDLVLDLHGILKSAIQVLFTRSNLKIGFAAPGSREGATFAYHRRVDLPTPLPHRAVCGLYLLRAIGLAASPVPATLPAADQVRVFPDATPGTRVVLHPGTSQFAAFKRWPAEQFGHLASALLADGLAVAVSYGPGESTLFEAIRAEAPGVLGIDGAQRGLDGLLSALREADVVVAADTGPLHMAAALGTRVVALFGPKDPDRYGPRGPDHAVLFHQVPCRPCRRRTCVSPQCVLGIDVEAVRRKVAGVIPAGGSR